MTKKYKRVIIYWCVVDYIRSTITYYSVNPNIPGAAPVFKVEEADDI